jgi:hypothetical protein
MLFPPKTKMSFVSKGSYYNNIKKEQDEKSRRIKR